MAHIYQFGVKESINAFVKLHQNELLVTIDYKIGLLLWLEELPDDVYYRMGMEDGTEKLYACNLHFCSLERNKSYVWMKEFFHRQRDREINKRLEE